LSELQCLKVQNIHQYQLNTFGQTVYYWNENTYNTTHFASGFSAPWELQIWLSFCA